MNDEEIIAALKKLIISGKRIGEICEESGLSRGTIQNLLRNKASISLITRLRFEEYCKKNLSLVK